MNEPQIFNLCGGFGRIERTYLSAELDHGDGILKSDNSYNYINYN